MIYVGIDVASTKHDIVILNESGEFFKKAFSIKNDLDGYKKLLVNKKNGCYLAIFLIFNRYNVINLCVKSIRKHNVSNDAIPSKIQN